MDITVAVVTEIMWTLVLQNHDLLDIAFKYTIRFLLAPVREMSKHLVLGMEPRRSGFHF